MDQHIDNIDGNDSIATPPHGGRRRPLRALLVATGGLAAAVVAQLVAAAPAPAHAARVVGLASWAPHLERQIQPLRAQAMGPQVATWYGPGLFGNGTACGGRLLPTTWGIAHRTLPCGALVTLTHRGRRVTVPVIDRGPFSGASVDLTARTKRYLRFVSGTVRMTRVKRYRVLPGRAITGTFAQAGTPHPAVG